jgi:hypothetical protein
LIEWNKGKEGFASHWGMPCFSRGSKGVWIMRYPVTGSTGTRRSRQFSICFQRMSWPRPGATALAGYLAPLVAKENETVRWSVDQGVETIQSPAAPPRMAIRSGEFLSEHFNNKRNRVSTSLS